MRKLILSISIIVIWLYSVGQTKSNLRAKQFVMVADTFLIDSLSLIPATVVLYSFNNETIDTSLFKVDYVKNILIAPTLRNSQLSIHYRVFDFNLTKIYAHKQFVEYVAHSNDSMGFKLRSDSWGEESTGYGSQLNANGSISRGISVGNNQDMIMNSSLNLQLNGEISPGVWILASMSDNNIPIQPNGNSQQLQDFDKVFVKIYNDNSAIMVGDFEVQSKTGTFLKYNKKAQGGMVETQQTVFKNKLTVSSSASYSISKGRHCKQDILSIEGNQGPYQITGCEYEAFIVILSGTEKVYIDGKLLERGSNGDYTIDYNAATIVFTSKQLITKDKRIVVEFEYSDQNYARSLITSNNEIVTKNTKTWINIFSEQDDKNQPFLRDLSETDIGNLTNAGDKPAFGSSEYIDSTFNENAIYYEKIDTIVNSVHDSIFRYAAAKQVGYYRVSFSYVGEGNGDYQVFKSSANGRVYSWVAPLANGTKQGGYLPVVQLIAPKQKQVFVIGNQTKLWKNTIISSEVAVSKNNENTFSPYDKNNDNGQAYQFGVTQNIPLIPQKHDIILKSNIAYIQKNFNPVADYQDIEFNRNWNISQTDTLLDELFMNVELVYKNKLGTMAYGYDMLQKTDFYRGYKNSFATQLSWHNYTVVYAGSIMNSSALEQTSRFLQSKVDVSKILFKITKLGIVHQVEDNRINVKSKMSIHSSWFDSKKVYFETVDSLKNGFRVSCEYRTDDAVDTVTNMFAPSTKSIDVLSQLFFMKNQNHQLQLTALHRRLEVLDTSLLQANEVTNMGQIDYFGRFFNGIVTTNSFYEFGSGMERDKDYMYYYVGDGLGVYMWDKDKTDYNGNGLPDLNEFEVARYDFEANYILVFIPTNKFVRTYVNQFNEVIMFDIYNQWKKHNDIRKYIALFTNRISYKTAKKNKLDDLVINMNPFNYSVNDTDLVSFSNVIRNDFAFNRRSSIFNANYIFSNSENKILTANGAESKILLSNTVNMLWNIVQPLTLSLNYENFRKQAQSDAFFFQNRNFDIRGNIIKPMVTLRPTMYFEVSLNYIFTHKLNNSVLAEKALFHTIGTELKYSSPQKGRIVGTFNYINITYDYQSTGSLTYEMLESLLPGSNFTWQASLQREVAKNLQLSIVYEGKKSESEKTIHTGNIQLRAYF